MNYLVLIILIWLIFSLIIASIAEEKGRTGIGYFFLAFIFSPLLALIILLISIDSDKKRFDRVEQEEEKRTSIRNEVTEKYINTIPASVRYENLEKLGSLLEKGIISKEEFEEEKKIILSHNIANIKKKEKQEPEKSNETFRRINEQIYKAKSSLFGTFNQELVDLIEEKCTDKVHTLELLKKYEELYKEDLIEKMKNISTNYDKIKNYLRPFIDLEIVEPEYPHKRITTADKDS